MALAGVEEDLAGVSKESPSGGRTRVGSKKYSTLALPVTKSTVRACDPPLFPLAGVLGAMVDGRGRGLCC